MIEHPIEWQTIGLDGIITTFAVVSGVTGADLSSGIILILGFANLLGDGFSMATGAFLSAKSGKEVYMRERQYAAEQVANAPEKEKQTLVELYQEQGYRKKDVRSGLEMLVVGSIAAAVAFFAGAFLKGIIGAPT